MGSTRTRAAAGSLLFIDQLGALCRAGRLLRQGPLLRLDPVPQQESSIEGRRDVVRDPKAEDHILDGCRHFRPI